MKAIFSVGIVRSSELIPRLISTSMWIGVLCGALMGLTAGVQAQQQVGYVVDFEGRWFVNGGQPVTRKGQSLPGGGTVGRQSSSEDDHIAIADLNGKIVDRRTCRNRGECDTSIKLAAPPKRRLLATAFSAVMSLVWGEPDRYAVYRSRDGELNDGVLQMKGEQIDLGPIFGSSEIGKYHLRLVPVAQGGKKPALKSVGPVTLDWDPKHAAPVPVPGLQFGLYELVLLEQQNGAYSPTDVTAWILISRPNAYGKSAASYQQAVALTKAWGKEVTPEAARSFLRAHLDQLAKAATK